MKKVILIDEQTVNALKKGKCVDGSIRMTPDGLAFRAYNHQKCGTSEPDRLLYQAACGHLKESKQRYKLWLSVPKSMGMCRAAVLLSNESDEITEYLHERGEQMEGGLIEFV